jgi:ATP-dependent RNA helicase RhlE
MALLRTTRTQSVLVFTRTKHRAKRLSEQLSHTGLRVACLQGNLSQSRRQSAIEGFRDGSVQILVATDIASRGIDVTRVSHVINYDMPDTADAYTHRIGRTGRVERLGDAFTLVTSADAEMVQTVERVVGSRLERRRLSGFDYSAPAPARPHAPPRPYAGRQARPRQRSA